ncbi:MAG: hypothetical protein Q9159_000350 [Coniocarpon cinnabarinum]
MPRRCQAPTSATSETYRTLCSYADAGIFASGSTDLQEALAQILREQDGKLLCVGGNDKSPKRHNVQTLKITAGKMLKYTKRTFKYGGGQKCLEFFRHGTQIMDSSFLETIGYRVGDGLTAAAPLSRVSPSRRTPPSQNVTSLEEHSSASSEQSQSNKGGVWEPPTAAGRKRAHQLVHAQSDFDFLSDASTRPSYSPTSARTPSSSTPQTSRDKTKTRSRKRTKRAKASHGIQQAQDPALHLDAANLQFRIRSIRIGIEKGVFAFCKQLIPETDTTRSCLSGAPVELQSLYAMGLCAGDATLVEQRTIQVLKCSHVTAQDILRCLCAAGIVAYVFDTVSPPLWMPPDKYLADLSPVDQWALRSAIEKMGLDPDHLLRRACLERANYPTLTHTETETQAERLTDRLMKAIWLHVQSITPPSQQNSLAARQPTWRESIKACFVEALRLKERLLATCPEAQLRFYAGDAGDRQLMREDGSEDLSREGKVALTIFPALMWVKDGQRGQGNGGRVAGGSDQGKKGMLDDEGRSEVCIEKAVVVLE